MGNKTISIEEYAKMQATIKKLQEENEHFIIKPFIISNRAEVKNMLIFEEFNEEKYKNLYIEEGREEGREERGEEIATNLLRAGGLSASFIAKNCMLSESDVLDLAKRLGVSVT